MTTPHDALRSILPVAGWQRDVSSEASFANGGDPATHDRLVAVAYRTLLGIRDDADDLDRVVRR